MGNILKDSSGNVLVSSGNAFEVTASVDSNITAGNIKKDVTILGVTGTYEGSGGGGGGFRCTNKILTSTEPLLGMNDSHTYTFSGELDSAALAILNPSSDLAIVGVNTYTGYTITYPSLMFQDKFCEPYYGTYNGAKLISNSLTFRNSDVNTTISINNQGVLSKIDQYSAAEDPLGYVLLVIFKGTDGTYDFDALSVMFGSND